MPHNLRHLVQDRLHHAKGFVPAVARPSASANLLRAQRIEVPVNFLQQFREAHLVQRRPQRLGQLYQALHDELVESRRGRLVIRHGLRRRREQTQQRAERRRPRAVLQNLQHQHVECLDQLRPFLHARHGGVEQTLQKRRDDHTLVRLPDSRRQRGLLEHLHEGVEDVLARAGGGWSRRNSGCVEDWRDAFGEKTDEAIDVGRHRRERRRIPSHPHNLVAHRLHTLHSLRVAHARHGAQRASPTHNSILLGHRRGCLERLGRVGLFRGVSLSRDDGGHRRADGSEHGGCGGGDGRSHGRGSRGEATGRGDGSRRRRAHERGWDGDGADGGVRDAGSSADEASVLEPRPRSAFVLSVHLLLRLGELVFQRVAHLSAHATDVFPRVLAAHLVGEDEAAGGGGAHRRVSRLDELDNLGERLVPPALHDVQSVALHQALEDLQHLEPGLRIFGVEASDEVAAQARRGIDAGDEPQNLAELFPDGFHGMPALVHERGEEERALLLGEAHPLVFRHAQRLGGEIQHPEQRLRVRGLLAEAQHDPSQEEVEVAGDALWRLRQRRLQVLHRLNVRLEVLEEHRVHVPAHERHHRRLEFFLRELELLVAGHLELDRFLRHLSKSRLLLLVHRQNRTRGELRRRRGRRRRAKRPRSRSSKRREPRGRRADASPRGERAVSVRARALQRRRRRRWIRRRRRRGRRHRATLIDVRRRRRLERRRRVDLVAHRERRLGPHASRHLVHHLPARRSRLRFDIGQTRGGGGDGVREIHVARRSLLPRGSHQRAVHPRERVRLTVPAHLRGEFHHLIRDVREGLRQACGGAPRVEGRRRGGAHVRLGIGELLRDVADDAVAVSTLADRRAHRLGHFPGGGERGGGEVTVVIGETFREGGEEIAGVGADAPIRAG